MKLLVLAPLALVLQQLASSVAADRSGPAAAVVTGVVYDSIVGAPIAGASVQFVSVADAAGRSFATQSDEDGRYELRDLPPGRYLAGFEQIALDSLGIENPPREVTVRDGSQRVPLATPSARTVATAICGPREEDDSTALLLGHVRRTATETAIAGATVTVEWREITIGEDGFQTTDRRAEVQTVGPGWFALCNLPSDAVLTTRAGHGADSSGYVEVLLPPAALRHHTYLIGGASRVLVTARAGSTGGEGSVALTRWDWRGDARLTGTVRDRDGRPLAGARAVVWGSDREAVSNDRGVFVLEGLPGGTQTLEVRLLGYVAVHEVVHLAASRPATADVVISDRVTVLSAVETRGELVYSRNLQGFERRQRTGWGQYLMPEEIRRTPNMQLARLLQQVHGVWVNCSRGRCDVSMRRPATMGLTGIASCRPSLYVDGFRDLVGDFGFLYSERIAAIEVYSGEIGRPPEFRDLNPCGAVVVWTRTIPAKPKGSAR